MNRMVEEIIAVVICMTFAVGLGFLVWGGSVLIEAEFERRCQTTITKSDRRAGE